VATALPPTQAPQATPTAVVSANPKSATIGVTGTVRFFWAPANVTIAPGGTVTWTWNEPVQVHNVAGANFPLKSGFEKSDTVSFKFDAPGTYAFDCEVHPGMSGTVVVK